MDNTLKISEIVYRLRKAKGLTQAELATLLHTTAKTVSNWERNKNSIPAEMFWSLAKVLDIDRSFFYEQYVNSTYNQNDINFFYCNECRNVFWSFSKTSYTCCGNVLKPLIAVSETNEHYLYTVNNPHSNTFSVLTDHPQTEKHRIEFIAYVTEKDVHIAKFYENKPFSVTLTHSPGGKLYMYCSNHGLFHNEIL